jgi:demethylmenaquinone methyltransferase/2-methoxy-6-polyprenyl-1,4-benzoquinol methylase
MAFPDNAAALSPHAPLRAYYGGPEEKSGFLRGIFDRTARDYDRVERVMALGTGSWYRRQALKRAGLTSGMKVLDVAAGTGMVAREAVAITGSPSRVIGLDPSSGMLSELTARLSIPVLLARGESLPVKDRTFDFLSMGYALRHLTDLRTAFAEFFRVLRPGGRVCLLEITAPAGRVPRAILRAYLRGVVPCLTRLTARQAESRLLWRYYWDTIATCVPPQRVLEAMGDAGFHEVNRRVELGVFSEYTGRKA